MRDHLSGNRNQEYTDHVWVQIIGVTQSGKTSSVTYVSTSTSSGDIRPTGAWMCQGPLCDTSSGCIIPLFCASESGSGASWGLCCGWAPDLPNGQSPPAGGPYPPPPQDGDNSQTQTQKSQTDTTTEASTSQYVSTVSTSASCSTQTASSCAITVSVFTPSGASSATTSTITVRLPLN